MSPRDLVGPGVVLLWRSSIFLSFSYVAMYVSDDRAMSEMFVSFIQYPDYRRFHWSTYAACDCNHSASANFWRSAIVLESKLKQTVSCPSEPNDGFM